MRVTAPNRAFIGRINGDTFFRGVCDDPSEENLAYYRRQGYLVTEDGPTVTDPEKTPETDPEKDSEDAQIPSEPDTEQVTESPDTDTVKDAEEREDAAEVTPETEPEDVDALPATPKAPKGNAPTAVWETFLRDQGVEFEPETPRADLIDLWEASQK